MNRLAGIAATLATLVAGLTGGVALSSGMLRAARPPGTVVAGDWKTWPRAGAPDGDPYARALFAKRGEAPLAPAEGLALYGDRDSSGAALTSGCAYRIAGRIPSARAWTVAVYRPDGSLAENAARRYALTSAEAVGDGEVVLARDPQPGNWLPVGPEGAFVVTLRLYDSPLTSAAAALDGERLPRIERIGCGS
jgi:hypothetical protein